MTPAPTPLAPDTVLALAPDPASAQSGRKLATPGKWQNLNAPRAACGASARAAARHPT
ncbi:hypothetical protein [Deinococcus aquaticus]|uniref:hypothetical protein n=1 Tax=Deinococcus aquaticus TaxID=328692 RepID=UPI00360661D2